MGIAGPLLRPGEKGERRPTVRGNGARSVAKVSRYEILKDKIRSWWDDRLKIGEALREIRDGKLYKSEYPNFEDFCLDEFGIKHTQAYRLIDAVGVKESVSKASPIGERIVNEGQARALAPVPEDRRVEVMEETAKAGPVTARAITEAAQTITRPKPSPKQEKQTHLDKTGYAIPDTVWDDWQRAETWAKAILSLVSDARSKLKTGLEEDGLILTEVTNSTVADLNNAYTSLKCVVPYAVCTTCQGHTRKKCNLCKGRGFISEFMWRQVVPEEVKKIRQMGVKK